MVPELTAANRCLTHDLNPADPCGNPPPPTLGGVRLLDAASASSSSGSSAGAGAGSGVAGLGAGGGAVARWGPLDDVVMGGVSSSGIELVTGAGEAGGAAWVFR